MNNSKFWLITGLIFTAVISRIIPHPFNVTPLIAVSLFAGAKFKDTKWAFIIPAVSFFMSDVILSYMNHYDLFHDTIFFTYASIVLIVLLGRILNNQKFSFGKTFGLTIASSLLFFIISNFGVWLFGNMYSMNIEGLINCYVMAIPFNKYSVLGDLFFVAVLFGTYEFVSAKYFTNSDTFAWQKSKK